MALTRTPMNHVLPRSFTPRSCLGNNGFVSASDRSVDPTKFYIYLEQAIEYKT